MPAGGAYCPMYKIRRTAGQTLATAAVFRMRTRVQPRISVETQAGLLEVPPLLYLAGTTAYCQDTDRVLRAGGTLAQPAWVATEGAQAARLASVGLMNNSGALQMMTPAFAPVQADTVNNWFAAPYSGANIPTGQDWSGIMLQPGTYINEHNFAAGNTVIAGSRNEGLVYLRRGNVGNREEIARGGVGVNDDSCSFPSAFTITDPSVMSLAHFVNVQGQQPSTVRHRVRLTKVA